MNKYGYIRVSSTDQSEARQVDAMRAIPICESCLYMDKQSGKDFCRPAYQKLVRKLKKGDELYVLSLDRLGRNYQEVREQWHYLTSQRGVDIIVMDTPLLDTRQSMDFLRRFVADMVLQIMSFAADNERRNIRSRQAQGIRAARKRGVIFGRPRRPVPPYFDKICQDCENGRITQREDARRCNMPTSTFRYKYKHEYKAKKDRDNRSCDDHGL